MEKVKFKDFSLGIQISIIGGWLSFIGFMVGFVRGLLGL